VPFLAHTFVTFVILCSYLASDQKNKEVSMSDLTGGRTHEMDATAAKFVSQAEEFNTSLANITSSVQALMSDWWGNSPVAYQGAMAKWNRDARQVVADLEEITTQLKGSSTSLTDLDNQLASMFNGFGG
jgi:WXG100 family type VII secretion target